jgi:cytochrome c1
MSSKKLTKQEVTDIIAYLQRVVPRGQEDADYLYRLMKLLEAMLDNR